MVSTGSVLTNAGRAPCFTRRPALQYRIVLGALVLTSPQAHAQTVAERPAIALNRWSENWSVLANPGVPSEPLDELKYIPLFSSDPQTYLSLGANVRERFEDTNAQFGVGASQQDTYLLSRLEAHSDLRIAGNLQFFLQLQSDEAPGKRAPSPVDADRLGVEQAFVAISEPFVNGEIAVRIGRQENGFDLQRFLSVRDGPNVRQAYDGISAAYTQGEWRFIALYTDPVQNRNQRAFDDYSSPRLSFGLIRAERTIGGASSLSVYFGQFRQDDARFSSVTGNERRDLVDVRFTGAGGGFDWDAEAMSQAGRMGSQTIQAWATGAIIGKTFDDASLQPRVSLQFDAASGDKGPTDNKLNTFNPLFPSGYYFNTAGFTTYANIVHAKVGFSVAPGSDLKLAVGAGVEWRATEADAIYTIPDIPLANTAGRGGSYVGAYGQFRVDYAVTGHINLRLEVVHFAVGQAIMSAGGHDTNYIGTEIRYGW